MNRRYRPDEEGATTEGEEHALVLESDGSRNAYGARSPPNLSEPMTSAGKASGNNNLHAVDRGRNAALVTNIANAIAGVQLGHHHIVFELEDAHMRRVGVCLVANDGIGYAPRCLVRVRWPRDGIRMGVAGDDDFPPEMVIGFS